MMNPQLELIQLSEKFCITATDDLIGDLSRVINLIISNHSKDIDYTCIYNPITNLINNKEVNSYLLSHLLTLLNKLGNNYETRSSMAEIMIPSISSQILYRYKQQPTDSLIKYCLETLHILTFDVPIRSVPPIISQMMHLLVKVVLKDSLKFTDLSLAVLANICRNSLIAQVCIKGMDSIRQVYSKLMKFLESDSITTIAYSLSFFTSLCLHEDLGKKLFVGNVKETFQLVINMLKTGDQLVKMYSFNLLIDFCKSDSMFKTFCALPNLVSILDEILQFSLTENNSAIQNKTCEFLHFISRDENIYSMILKIVENSDDLISYIFENVSEYEVAIFVRSVLPDILDFSHEGDQEMLLKNLVVIIDNIPLHINKQQRYKTVSLACQCFSTLAESKSYRLSVESYSDRIFEALRSWLDHTPNPYDRSNEEKFNVEACNSFLNLFKLLRDLRHPNLNILLDHQYFPIFLAKSLSAPDNQVVVGGLDLYGYAVQAGGQEFVSLVGSFIANDVHVAKSERDRLAFALRQSQQNKQEVEREIQKIREENRVPSPVPSNSSEVNELITEIKDGLKIGDVKTSQLIEIFQEKIVVLTTKEQHLNDLVEAKTLALQQSDRLFTQLRNRVSQAEQESLKFRTLLQESEKENEQKQEKMAKLDRTIKFCTSEMERLTTELEEAEVIKARCDDVTRNFAMLQEKHETLVHQNDELSNTMENLKEEVAVLRTHNETLKGQHEVDVNQIQILQKEKQKIVSKLEEKDETLLKTKQSLRQAEDKIRKKDQERTELESMLERTKNDLNKFGAKVETLEESEASLKATVLNQIKDIEIHQTTIKSLKEEVDKYEKLMAMFHNLSSGKKK